MKIAIFLTQEEANGLRQHLGSMIGKGSMSTTPSWAKRICGKIDMARYEAKQRENRQCSECGGFEADNGVDDICDCGVDEDTGDLCRFGR